MNRRASLLTRFVSLLSLGVMLLSCSTRPTNTGNGPRPIFHTVRHSGETLGIISSWYTGSSDNWQKLVRENPGLRVHRLKVGDEVYIPGQLVKRRGPLTRSFVVAWSKTESFRRSDTSRPREGLMAVRTEPTAPARAPTAPEESPTPAAEDLLADAREELLKSLLGPGK
jgi:hypothetical protein